MTYPDVLAFIAHSDHVNPEAAMRIRFAALAGGQWAHAYLGCGWTGTARDTLVTASATAAAELQIVCELNAAARGTVPR